MYCVCGCVCGGLAGWHMALIERGGAGGGASLDASHRIHHLLNRGVGDGEEPEESELVIV